MRYRLLGKSGLRVSELCLGTMTFGEDWGWGSSKDESRQVLDAFLEAGGNFIDTANIYTNGRSETLLGEFLKGDRDRAVLATKYTNAMPGTDPNAGGNQRKNMMRSVEASLKRLQTDYIDLYWLHIWDRITPLDEVMRAFDDLVRQGKILHAGVSDMAAWAVARANTLAELRGWTPFVGLQIEYSLIERTVERELIPMSEALGLGVTAWSPLAGGVLTGKYAEGKAEADARMNSEMMKGFNRADERAKKVSPRSRLSPAKSAGPRPRFPSPGSASADPRHSHHRGPKAGTVQGQPRLPGPETWRAQIDRLDAASQIELGFPHEFYARDW